MGCDGVLPTQGGSAENVSSTVVSGEVGGSTKSVLSVGSVLGSILGSVGSVIGSVMGSIEMGGSTVGGGSLGPLVPVLSPFLPSFKRRRLRWARTGGKEHERKQKRRINARNGIEERDRPPMLRWFVWRKQQDKRPEYN